MGRLWRVRALGAIHYLVCAVSLLLMLLWQNWGWGGMCLLRRPPARSYTPFLPASVKDETLTLIGGCGLLLGFLMPISALDLIPFATASRFLLDMSGLAFNALKT